MVLSQLLWQDPAEFRLPDVISVVSRSAGEEVLGQQLLEISDANRYGLEVVDPFGMYHAGLVSEILQPKLKAGVNHAHDGPPGV